MVSSARRKRRELAVVTYVLALVACLLGGCNVAMSSDQPWVPIETITGPLAAEAGSAAASTPRPPLTEPLRVATYNVQFGADVEGIAAAIQDDPDLRSASVLLVQEIEAYPDEGGSRASRLAAQLGLGYVYVPGRVGRTRPGGTYGLAILSAFPISNVEKMDLPDASPTPTRIAVQADLDVDGQTFHIIDVYLGTRLNAQGRIRQLHPVVIDAPPLTLVAGDFNTCWVQWVDTNVPVLSSTEASDQAPVVDDYMRALAFDTPTTQSGPTEHMYGIEQRLDSIFTRGLTPAFGAVARVGPSDHWPMWIDVTLPH